MAYIINDIVVKPRVKAAAKRLNCLCNEANYSKKKIANGFDVTKEADKKPDAENMKKYGEAAKAYIFAKK